MSLLPSCFSDEGLWPMTLAKRYRIHSTNDFSPNYYGVKIAVCLFIPREFLMGLSKPTTYVANFERM